MKTLRRNSGGTGTGVLIGLAVVVGLVVVVGGGFLAWYIGGYNRAVNFKQGAQKAWADVDAALQRRLDLVPNLVNIVKGYATHEKELFENIAKSREKYFQADTRAGKMEATGELSSFLSRLMMLQENYPQLKASENFRDLQAQLEGTENRINQCRRLYNEAAKNLNAYTDEFFGSFFCKRANVEPVEFFKAEEKAKEAPEVKF